MKDATVVTATAVMAHHMVIMVEPAGILHRVSGCHAANIKRLRTTSTCRGRLIVAAAP